MKRFELHILPTHGLKLTQDSGDSGIWEEQQSDDGSFVKLKTSAVSLFSTGNVNCGWECYTRPSVLRKRRGMHTWCTPCTSTSTTTTTATKFEVSHHNAYGQFISAVRDNEWYMVPYGTLYLSTATPYYEQQTATKLTGTATATIIGTDTTTATVTCTAGPYPCLSQYGSYTLLSSIGNIPWKWQIGDTNASALITSGSMYKFKYLATFYNTIFGAFDGTSAGAISIRFTNENPSMAALSMPAANQIWKPDEDYGITALHPFGRKALLVFGRKSICGIDYYSGYTPRFSITLMCNGVGTTDHNSVVVTDNAIYFYDRLRGAFIEYTGGSSYNVISDDIRILLEDLAMYEVDVFGSYDPRYDMVSWSLKSTGLGYYDCSIDNIVTETSTYASNPVSNFVLQYHRPTKQWFPDSQRLYDSVTGYQDFILKSEVIQQVNASQRSRGILIPNFDSQMYYEIEEYYTQQTVSYPMTRVEPMLWHPVEDRHKRIQEVRFVFGATADVPLVDNITATSQKISAAEGYNYPASVVSTSSAPYDDVAWTSVDGAKADNDTAWARVALSNSKKSELLWCSGFNFSSNIPDSATINSVIVYLEAHNQVLLGASRYGQFAFMKLIDNTGALTGSDIITTNVTISNTPDYPYSFGGDVTTVWGATLTPAIVKSANFGVAIGLDTTSTSASDLHANFINYVKMMVYYTYTSTTYEYDGSGVAISDSTPTVSASCIYGDHKHLMASTPNRVSLGMGTPDSNGECVFYTDISCKYYQFIWGQTPAIANGADCPVSKIIVKGYVY